MNVINDIEEKLKTLPEKSGVYIMKNSEGNIIYVGKAKVLKNRVRQYFKGHNHSLKVKRLVENIADFEYIITDSEQEALILENNLIKENMPKYNVLLKDDKTYPFIKITTNEDFPRVFMTRRVVRDGAKYFGPYCSNFNIKEVLEKSPLEIEVPCPHFGQCGGCTYQNLPYKEQGKMKEVQIKEKCYSNYSYLHFFQIQYSHPQN